MPQYLVTWNIDEEADTPEAAARQAFARIRRTIPKDPGNCAVYDVSQIGRAGYVRVDLGAGTIEDFPAAPAAQGQPDPMAAALDLLTRYIDVRAEDQHSGESEGFYDEEEGRGIWTQLEHDRLTVATARLQRETMRAEIIEECAQAAEAVDRIGREWVRDSLWAQICARAGQNVRALLKKGGA